MVGAIACKLFDQAKLPVKVALHGFYRVIGALVGAAAVLLYIFWKRLGDGPLPPASSLQEYSGFIPLKEAATRAYETFRRGGGIGKMVPDELSQTDPLSWCASFLTIKEIPLYGSHPPSRDRERIPKRDARHLHIENDCSELHEIMSSRNPIWKELQVREADLQPILKHIENQYSADA